MVMEKEMISCEIHLFINFVASGTSDALLADTNKKHYWGQMVTGWVTYFPHLSDLEFAFQSCHVVFSVFCWISQRLHLQKFYLNKINS